MTTIREFFTKLVKADDSAQKMMDANLERNQVRFIETSKGVYKLTNDLTKGSKLTADAISNIAQEDATQAVNIMSQLVGKNLLDMETLIKVFNGRYGLIVSNLLRTINGDIEDYVDNINESTSLTEDLAKQQNNLNNQWQIFKNRLFGANSETINITKNMGNLLGLMGNGVLSAFNTEFGRLVFSFISTATAVGLMGVGVKKLTNLIKLATVETGIWGAVTNALPFMAIVTAISLATSVIMHFASKQQEAKDAMADMEEQIKDNVKSTEELRKEYKAITDTMAQFDITKITNGFGSIDSVMSGLTGTTNGLKDSINELYEALSKQPNADKTELGVIAMKKSVLQKQMAKYMAEANAIEQKIGNRDLLANKIMTGQATKEEMNMLERLKFLKSANKQLELENSKLGKSYEELNKKVALSDQATQEDQLKKAQEFNQKTSTIIYKNIMDIASKSKAKTKTGLFDELLGLPNLKQHSTEFINIITSMDKVIKPLSEFTLSEMKDPEYISYVLSIKDAYDTVATAEAEYKKNSSQNNLDILTATKATLSSMLYAHKVQNQSNDTSKKDETTKMEILNLSTKYNEELIKTLKFNSDDLTILRDKRAELQRMYEMRAEESRNNIKSEFGYAGAFTEEALTNELKRLETQKKAIESAYPEKSKMPTLKSDEYKNIVEDYKAIDEYLASMVVHGKDLKSIENDRVNLLKTEKSNLFEYLKSNEEIYATQLQLNELQNERLSIGRSEADNYKTELDLITNRYEYEMKMLKMKRDYLLGTYGLSMNNLEAERDSILNIQRGGITALEKGFANGGYTGNGKKYDIAGIVHRGELVIDAKTLKENPSLLSLYYGLKNNKKGYANGSTVTASSFLSTPEASKIDPVLTAWLKSFNEKYKDVMEEKGVSLYISDALRTIEEQKKFMATGKSKTLNSKHLTGNALDLVFKNKKGFDWNDSTKWLETASADFNNYLKNANVSGTWGGNWDKNDKTKDKFIDKFHFQTDKTYNYKENVLDTQKFLKSQGYDIKVDGIWGKNTEKAYSDYQSRQQTSKEVEKDKVVSADIPKTTFALESTVDSIIEKLTDVSLKLPDLIDTSLKNIYSFSLDTNNSTTTSTGEGRLPTKDEQAKLSAIYEIMKSINEEEMLREQLIQSIATKTIDSTKSSIENSKTNTEYLNNIKTLSSYKDRMYNSESQNEDYTLQQRVETVALLKKEYENFGKTSENKINSLKVQRSLEWEILENTMRSKGISEVEIGLEQQKFNSMTQKAILMAKNNLANEQGALYDAYTLEQLKLQNEQLEIQYKKHSAITSAVMSLVENVASGKGMSFDISQVRDSAMESFTEVASGERANTEDYLAMGSYVAGIVDQFSKSEFASKQQSLSWEQKILDLRLQGAKTEAEKLAIEQQQYELQVQALELAYKQQTSFMGISGVGGSALSGGLSLGMTGASMASGAGGLSTAAGAGIGIAIGAAMGINSAMEAKTQLALQKEQLETERDIAEYTEDTAKALAQNNQILSEVSSNMSKVGVQGAINAMINTVSKSNKYDITGSGSSDWQYSYKSGGFLGIGAKTKTATMTETATYGLSDFGLTTADLTSISDYKNLLTTVNTELTKVSLEGQLLPKSNLFGLGKEQKAERLAKIEALENMIDTINVIIKLQSELAKSSVETLFGGSLVEKFAEDGETITGYYTDWTDYLSTLMTSSISNISSSMIATGNTVTSTMFGGLNSAYVQNYSNLTSIATKIESVYSNISSSIVGMLDSGFNASNFTSDFKSMIAYIEEYKQEQESINDVADKFITMWLDNGGVISDVYESLTESAKEIYDVMKTSLGSESYESLLSDLGSSVGTTFMDSFKSKLMDTSGLTSVFQDLYAQLNTSVTDLSVQSASNLMSAITTASVALDYQARQVEAISSIFDTTSKISYNNDEISYSTGSTKSTINNYNITSNMNSDIVFTDDQASVNYFCTSIASNVKNALVEIGADL